MAPRKKKEMLKPGDLKKVDKAVIKRLLSYLNPYKGRIICVFLCIIISTVGSVASSLFLQTLRRIHFTASS